MRSLGVSRVTAEVGTRSRLIRLSRSNGQVRGNPPPMVDALRRVRLRRSGTRLWTCCAGRAGTRIRSEALHRILTIGRPAADRAGARPYHPIGIASSDRQTQASSLKRGLYDQATAPIQDYPVQLTIILDSSEFRLNAIRYPLRPARAAVFFLPVAEVNRHDVRGLSSDSWQLRGKPPVRQTA